MSTSHRFDFAFLIAPEPVINYRALAGAQIPWTELGLFFAQAFEHLAAAHPEGTHILLHLPTSGYDWPIQVGGFDPAAEATDFLNAIHEEYSNDESLFDGTHLFTL